MLNTPLSLARPSKKSLSLLFLLKFKLYLWQANNYSILISTFYIIHLLEILHFDLNGKFPTSKFLGFKYSVSFIKKYFYSTTFCFFQKKSECFKFLKIFHLWTKIQIGHKFYIFQSD